MLPYMYYSKLIDNRENGTDNILVDIDTAM